VGHALLDSRKLLNCICRELETTAFVKFKFKQASVKLSMYWPIMHHY